MTGIARSAAAAALAVTVFGGLLAACTADEAPSNDTAAVDRYAFAGECVTISNDNGALRLDDGTWTVVSANGSPIHMQATGLGTYLLYGPAGTMVDAPDKARVATTTTPGPTADWTLEVIDGRIQFTSVATGLALLVDGTRVTLGDDEASDWTLTPATGCATFPDIDPGVDGTPFTGSSPDAKVRGFFDAHTHITAAGFLGGAFHCGRAWSPYGVTAALVDCPSHADGEIGAVTDGLLASGSLDGTHDQSGWPEFTGWPNVDSLTHEGTYWRWIERAWRGGLRLMVNHFVDNRALCEIYPVNDGTECNDMANIRDQAADLRAMEAYIDAQFKGPGKGFFRIVETPEEARKVINDGKLAVVMGVEVSEVLDCGRGTGPRCDRAAIDDGLDELADLGVRTVFPVHKFDNGLGGTMYDGGITGVFVNVGNRYATGEWWDPQPCAPGQTPDNTVIDAGPILEENADLLADALGEKILPLIEDGVPDYPEGPHCNPKGLTDDGKYVIRALADRGMIVETDHLSALARSQAFDVLEELAYPGVISSHTWDDPTSRARLEALGGMVSPYAGGGYPSEWEFSKEQSPTGDLPGIGFASDTNGLAPQPDPREGAGTNPVVYPFTTFDGGSTVRQQVSGTRTYDVNVDGAAHYGLFIDWIEDLRVIAGDELIDDMSNGAEAYLQLWERATTFAAER